MNRKDLFKVLGALASGSETHAALAVYVRLEEFQARRITIKQLQQLTGLGRSTVVVGLRVLGDLGLVADGVVLDLLSEASWERVDALRAGLLSVNKRTGELTDHTDLAKAGAAESAAGAAPVASKHVPQVRPVFMADGVADMVEKAAGAAPLTERSSLPKSSDDSDLVAISEPVQLDLSNYLDNYLGKVAVNHNKNQSVICHEPATAPKLTKDQARIEVLRGMLNPSVVEVMDFWRQQIQATRADWGTPNPKKLESYLKSTGYVAIAKALQMGYSVTQLKAVAKHAGGLDNWHKANFRNLPGALLKDADTIDRLIVEGGGKPKKPYFSNQDPKDRRGLGLGMNGGENDVISLF